MLRPEFDPKFFRYVMFSDKTTFHYNDQLNRHNCPHWWKIHIDSIQMIINIPGILLCGVEF